MTIHLIFKLKILHLNLIYINIKQMLKTMELQHSPKKIRRQLKLHYNKDEKLLNLRNSLTYEEGNKTWAALMECIKSPNIRKLWLGKLTWYIRWMWYKWWGSWSDCDPELGEPGGASFAYLLYNQIDDNKIHSGGIRKLILNSWPKLKLISLSKNVLIM